MSASERDIRRKVREGLQQLHLRDIRDVDIDIAPSDGHLLEYDADTGLWAASAPGSFSDGINVDNIDEYTTDAGVTIDGLLIKDGFIDASYVEFQPDSVGDWPDVAPGNVDGALNILADWIDRVEQSIGTTGGGSATTLAAAAFRESGSTNLSTSVTDIPLDTEDVSNPTFTLNTDGTITINNDGTYLCGYTIPINDDGTGGATRGQVRGVVYRDPVGLGANTAIPQSYGGDYHREASGGSGVSSTFIFEASAGDIITLRCQVSSTVDVSTSALYDAALWIMKVA